MDDKKVIAVKAYFESKISYYKADAIFLASDNRLDEAVFAKVQMNVYDIFNTLFSAAIKSYGSDTDNVRDFFLKKMEEIPENWLVSLQRAEQYGDAKKAYIEQKKLDAAIQIKKEFMELWEAGYD